MIYNWFKPVKLKQDEQIEEEEEEYNSDIYDNIDDDDLIKVDEINDDDQNEKFSTLNIEEISDNTEHTKKRRLICIGLQFAEISKYIKQTSAQFGGSCHIEVVARELF